MARETIVPFGPQHPVLPEPLQLKLTLDGQNISQLLPAFGYVHRGIEKACERQDYQQNVFLVERVCGICSSIHALAYCLAVEEIMGLEVPERGTYLRVIFSELHRLHSHLLWLGLLAEAFGFESLFMQMWRIRESIMDIMEKTAGNRVIISVSEIGGARRDLSPEHLAEIFTTLEKLEADIKQVYSTLTDDYTVKRRTVGKGPISGEVALELGAVGPDIRASGVAQDARMTGYCCYDELGFEPIVETGGDTHARCLQRLAEINQSIDLIRKAIDRMPMGDIKVKPRGFPNGSAIVRVEAPRGELLYMVVGNGTKYLERVRIRVPTLANVPMMVHLLQGCEFTDLPVVALSIDPCLSCTER
jgi:ech hydrogenase subunit E